MSGLCRTILCMSVCCALTPVYTDASSKDEHASTRSAPVAVLLDLQGAQASIGRPAMNGFVLGLQQVNKTGNVYLSALIDTQSDPEVTRSAANGIASRVKLAAGFTDNDSVLIAGPVFHRAHVPFLSIGATDPTLPVAIGDSIFLVPFGDNTQAAAAAEFGLGAFGNSVAILWDSTSQYTRTLPRYFRTRFEELGGAVSLDVSYDGGCDLTPLAEQVIAQQPQFVYLAGLPDCIGNVVASLRAAGVSQPVVGGDGLDTPRLLQPEPVNDVWFTTHAWLSEETGTPEAKAFIADYREAYGTEPPDAFAALGYDAARLMHNVFERVDNSSHRAIVESLETTRGFEGVTGTISYNADSHVPLKTVWVIAVQNGQQSLARAFIPDSVPPPMPVSP